MTTRVLLTGAGGFIGHHTLSHLLTETDWHVIATDSFRHKGKTDRINQVLDADPQWRPRVTVHTHDLSAPFSAQAAERIGRIDHIIAMASQSHVDRSIADPVPFVRTNTDVILTTLELARVTHPESVIVISTDEVYGPCEREDAHPEWSPVIPSNPYAASKAAQEAIAVSYWRTYGVPVVIVNCMNAIGERQDPEKFVPKLIKGISSGQTVTIHGREGDIGSRHYLHARNFADGLLFIMRHLPPARFPDVSRPDRYNVASPEAIGNLDLALEAAQVIGKPLKYQLVDFHSARPGHDAHYGLDPRKLEVAGWKAPVPFSESLARTVRWTLNHPEWLLED